MGRLAAFFKVADVNVQWSLVGREWSVGGDVGGPRDGRGSIFTARCYASAVLAMALCPSVCLSVTSRCSTKTAKRRITQTNNTTR